MVNVITPEQFEKLLPLACSWAAEQEQMILEQGVPLSEAELADARTIGVREPERVRLLPVPRIPRPTHPTLAAAADVVGFISPETAGLTVRYGIFIRDDCWGHRHLVIHELAHTMQYERMGGFEPFLREYLQECLTIGYPDGPMEQEAGRIEAEFGW